MHPWINLPDLLIHNTTYHPHQMALFSRRSNELNAPYLGITYQVFFQRALAFALGLHDSGVRDMDKVALLSGNRSEWVIGDMGIMMLGAVGVSVYPTLSAAEILYILKDSESSVVIAETLEHIDILIKLQPLLPHLRLMITIDEISELEDRLGPNFSSLSFSEVIRLGENQPESIRQSVQESLKKINRDHLASIVYTSGTTGSPKGVMLSHGNFLSNVEDVLRITPLSAQDSVLSFLPLSHVFERTVGYYSILAIGGRIYYAQNMTSVSRDLLDAKPTILVSVPRLYEKIKDKIYEDLVGLKSLIFKWALSVGKESKDRLFHSFRYALADRLVFSKIRAKTGGNLRFFVSGGAPLSAELGHFFEALSLIIIEGYGLTETAPIIAGNQLSDYKFGTVGKALPSVEVKLGEDNELLVRGPNVMQGYYSAGNVPIIDPDVIDSEGWLHTGDIAKIDSEGFISIIDRKKELIVLSNGKKIPPQLIEQKLRSSPYISQVFVIGEKRNYLTALILPHFTKVDQAIKKVFVAGHETLQILDPDFIAFIEQEVSLRLSDMAPFEKIKKFTLLSSELTPESGALTPTLKPKRRVIEQQFLAQIQAMYDEKNDSKGPTP